jgi:hypothetical protein
LFIYERQKDVYGKKKQEEEVWRRKRRIRRRRRIKDKSCPVRIKFCDGKHL